MLTDKSQFNTGDITENKNIDYFKIYRAAIIANILNPKAALFFIAFIPQFIDPTLKHTVLPFFTLGIPFITTGMTWCLIVAIFASAIFAKLIHNKKVAAYINKICGFTLISLGVKVALNERK